MAIWRKKREPKKRNKLNNEKGAAAVLVVIALTVLLGVTALVVDAGSLYLHDAKLANALDASALAGSQALPDSPALAYQLAENYAAKNGVPPEDLMIQITDDQRGIKVQAKRQVNYAFARVLGLSSGEVNRAAGAKIGIISSVKGVVPFTIQEQELVYNEEYVLKSGAGADFGEAPHFGWYGAIRLGGNGANVYERNLKEGYQSKLGIGDVLDVENGNMSGPTTRGVEYRINQCKHTPACTSEHFAADCPRLLTVPVVASCGNGQVKVKGFAMFFLERVDGQGNRNNVWGKFVQAHLPGEITEDEGANYGVYSSYLTH
jgi:hypothetical protein